MAGWSISLKFERVIANEYRKIFTITKNSCVKHENLRVNATKFVACVAIFVF